MKNKIPARWLEYTPIGQKVAGTRFIAFKAPLSKEICRGMKDSERFTPSILMEKCPSIQLIIDLTNTDRYYNKQEFIDRGIQYEKIMCPGQVIPPQSLIYRFFEIIDDFYLKNGARDFLIGIHCTHGVNRTGYFIGRYMVQRMGFHFEKAIPCIEEARGHKIERLNYVKDLMVHVPIPSSLSGKKDSKSDLKKSSNSNNTGKGVNDKMPEKRSLKKPIEPPSRSNNRSRSPLKAKEALSRSGAEEVGRQGGRLSGRHASPVRRTGSPIRRGLSSGRRGVSPSRRPPSPPVRHDGRGPSPRRHRSPPKPFSPPRNRSPRRSPPRRISPPRGMSPLRRESGYGALPYRSGEDTSRGPGSHSRGYSPPRRMEAPSRGMESYSRRDSPPRQIDYLNRGPSDRQSYARPSNEPFRGPYDRERGYDPPPSVPPSKYGPSQNFPDSRSIERRPWDNQPSFRENRHPPNGEPELAPWNQPSKSYSGPPSNFNAPPNFDARQPPPSARFGDRRLEETKREEVRRPWNEDKPNSGPQFNVSRYEDNRNFADRGNDFRGNRPEPNKLPFRSPPRSDFSRDKRPPSPFRDSRRETDRIGRPDHGFIQDSRAPWETKKRSPEPAQFGDYPRGGDRRTRSPGRRPPSPPRRKSRSPRRRTPPRFGGIEGRKSPPRHHGRTSDVIPSRPFSSPSHDRPVPELPFQDKRYYDVKDDCRDLLNQKRNFDGRESYGEPKSRKLDLKDIPKEVDLRKVIGIGSSEPGLKTRLGPHPREDRPGSTSRDERFRPPPRDETFVPPSREERFVQPPPSRDEKLALPPPRDNRYGGPPPVREDRFSGPPPIGDRFGGSLSRDERFSGPPSKDDRFSGPPLKEERFGGPPSKDDRYGGPGPSYKDNRFSGPPSRDDRFGGPPSRDDRFGGPPFRNERFSGPPSRDDHRFTGPPPRDDRFGGPPSGGDPYGVFARDDPMDAGRRLGRGRSRSPIRASPPRHAGGPRRY